MSAAQRAQGEHDELIARFADLYLDDYRADLYLRTAAQMLDGTEYVSDVRRLVKAAHEYRRVASLIEEMKEGVDIEVLYGEAMVIAHALQLAKEIRWDRRRRQDAAEHAEVRP